MSYPYRPKLEKIMVGLNVETFYKGTLVKKTISGFEIFGKKAKTIKEVDAIINQSCEAIKLSIK